MIRFAFAFAALSAGCSSLSTTKECTLIACRDGMSARIELGRPILALNGGRVRGCREQSCSDVPLATDVPANRVDLGSSGDGWTVSREAGRDDVLVVAFGNYGAGAEPRDGETFSVEVFAPDGSTVAARSGAVKYTRVRPNGPGCDPECAQAELE